VPRIEAFLEARGVALSAEKTPITPLPAGFDFLGQTLRKFERPHQTPGKLHITPGKAGFQALKVRIRSLCKQAKGTAPARLIDTLNPIVRGWARYHRHVICGETFAKLDRVVGRRLFRWAKNRRPRKTGRWIAQRYFLHGTPGSFTDPDTGKQIIRVQQAVKTQRHLKIRGAANPFDPEWDDYFAQRDRQQTLRASSSFRAKILNHQRGPCPCCRQVIQFDADIELHHRDGNHHNNRLVNLVLLHPNCRRQVHSAPDSTTKPPRPVRGVGHA